MNSKHRKTLEAIFADPVKPSIAWNDIETVFQAFGGTIRAGRGSRAWFIWETQVAVFHRPHPQPTTDKGAVKSVRRYFANIGLKP
ncbi:type II toxin-antitoxin system HicA family toxin [uncultured Desulfovibrio sp.]|uniref:type II toxin-antitoxin system HicA family toxin n=1 Tax=uncultured Desulfovibrio sp. TaxID=167968 RepID=UPI0027121C3E|nr:type II toxin-antitoxin system HicA family toxin [uncultured Desulfovibrio sp.]